MDFTNIKPVVVAEVPHRFVIANVGNSADCGCHLVLRALADGEGITHREVLLSLLDEVVPGNRACAARHVELLCGGFLVRDTDAHCFRIKGGSTFCDAELDCGTVARLLREAYPDWSIALIS